MVNSTDHSSPTESADPRTLLGQLCALNPSPASDFFVVRLQRELDMLQLRLVDALTSGCLSLDDAHAQSHLVLAEAFALGSSPTFRATHFLADSKYMFGSMVRAWQEQLDQLLSQGRVAEVRRLAVFSTSRQLTDPDVVRLRQLHSEKQGYQMKFIENEKFRQLGRILSFPMPHDIGIYSDQYMFVATSTDPLSTAGRWYRRTGEVSEAIEFFDECWQAAEVF